jgi:glucose/arabinose dehydrogenase
MLSSISKMIAASAIVLTSVSVNAQITLVPFTSNVTAVTDIKHCNDDRLFIVEQAGRIKISDLQGNLNALPFLNISNKTVGGGERGLLGLAFSPNYQTDGRFYVDYTNLQGHTVIARYNVSATDPDRADSLSAEILFTVTQPYSNHNGGALFFGKDGYLYISMGDGGSGGDPGNRAQNLQENLGKLLRINVNVPSGFSIPGSNPFFGSSTANPRIWAYGLRNAWRISKDRLTGDIWIGDVGQDLWEEIDFQPANNLGGVNYGWRCYEGNVGYNTTGCQPQSSYQSPVYVFPHGPACSVTGGYVYRGAQHAALFGKYIFTDYCDGKIKTLEPNGVGGYNFTTTNAIETFEFVTLGEDKYGELYVGRTSTGVLKLSNPGCSPTAFIGSEDTVNYCGSDYTFSTPYSPGFLYQWYLNGSVIVGADTSTYTASQNGNYSVQVVNTNFCTTTSDTITLNLTAAPAVSFNTLPANVCINAAAISLSGTPVGGVFSGAGVAGSSFDAATATVGTHVITYTYDNGNGCIVSSIQTIVVDACLSLQELNSNVGFSLSPNPAQNNVNIVLSSGLNGSKHFEIFDVSGKLRLQFRPVENTDVYQVETSSLAAGVYIVKMWNENTPYYQKLVIK